MFTTILRKIVDHRYKSDMKKQLSELDKSIAQLETLNRVYEGRYAEMTRQMKLRRDAIANDIDFYDIKFTL